MKNNDWRYQPNKYKITDNEGNILSNEKALETFAKEFYSMAKKYEILLKIVLKNKSTKKQIFENYLFNDETISYLYRKR
jgi:hypothetical protein